MSLPPASYSPAPPPTDTTTFPPAELDRRFSAFAIDRTLAWGLSAGVAAAVWWLAAPDRFWVVAATCGGVVLLLGLVTAVLVGATGLTPGKAVVGLRVVRRSDGRPIGLLPALGRTVVLGVAGLPTLGLGIATLAWTAAMDPARRRRGLHDRIGDAVVVDVRPLPVEVADEDDRPQQVVNLTAMRLLPPPPEPATPTPTSAPTATPTPTSAPTATPTPAQPTPVPAPVAAPQAPQAPPAPLPTVAPPAAAPTSAGPAHPAQGPTQVRPTERDRPAARWRVTFDTGEEFVVEGLAIVGRKPEARAGEPVRHVVPLRSTDMSLSKTHAQFQVAPDGALVVMDRGSTNGSYIVRKGVSKALSPGRPSTLLDGDVVRFGDRSMQVGREG